MDESKPVIIAAYAAAAEDKRVQCNLCPVRCVVAAGRRGVCNLRENRDGTLYAVGYGEATSIAIDPIEKKPLYHFHPGDTVLSLGPNGCNLKCRWCQNYEISQLPCPTRYLSPAALVALAREYGSPGISFTYSEPLVWFEYVRDAARAAHEAGIYTVAVTNGYLEEEPAREIAEYLDAANVDVKAMSDRFYKEYCGGKLAPVLRTCEIFKKRLHVEITNLLIPDLNDREEDVAELVAWVAGELGKDTPVHFSRYFPHYKFHSPPTPPHHLLRAREIATRDLLYVYLGNVSGIGGNDTHCPQCDNLLVQRAGYTAKVVGIKDGKCNRCGRPSEVIV